MMKRHSESKSKTYLPFLAIVAVVAIVAIVMLVMNKSGDTSSLEESDGAIAGKAYSIDSTGILKVTGTPSGLELKARMDGCSTCPESISYDTVLPHLRDLSIGDYTLFASKDYYISTWKKFNISPGQTTTVDLALVPAVKLSLTANPSPI